MVMTARSERTEMEAVRRPNNGVLASKDAADRRRATERCEPGDAATRSIKNERAGEAAEMYGRTLLWSKVSHIHLTEGPP
jgi:hypothetical protein